MAVIAAAMAGVQVLRLRVWKRKSTEHKENTMVSKTIVKWLSPFLGLGMLLIGQQAAAQSNGLTAGQSLPPNAKPGECYARVLVPAVYKTENVTMLKQSASENVGIVAATFKPAEERMLAKEASTRIEVVPATYGMVEEQVLVKPASSHLEAVPAVFETVTTQVLEKAGYSFWKKGTGPITKVDNATGEILCLVEVPPVYKTVTSQVLKTPATTREVAEPAVYSTVKHQVVKTPATTRVIEIPAEYQTVQVTRLIDPAGAVRTPIAAQNQTVTRSILVSDERFEWQSIMCETNTPAPVKTIKMQPAPKTPGYDASADKTQNDASFFKSAQGTWWAPISAGDEGYRN